MRANNHSPLRNIKMQKNAGGHPPSLKLRRAGEAAPLRMQNANAKKLRLRGAFLRFVKD